VFAAYIACSMQPLARLSKVLQNSEGNIAAAMEMVKAVLGDISQYKNCKILQTNSNFNQYL
jgi:hypothetical protein